MMSRGCDRRAFLRWIGLALASLVVTLTLATPASAQATSRLKCESFQFQPARCPVPGIIDATIINVVGGDCRPGNWGFDRNGVWVINGCRAYFNVRAGNWGGGNPGWGGGNPGWGTGGRVVRCESWEFRPARCAMDTRGGVQIQQAFSRDCTPGNWGFDRNGVWVINGCRADFVSGGGGGGWGGGNPGFQTIDCNSINYRPARCDIRVPGTVQIERVFSGECIANRTWGWDRNGIWVNNGCRARFRVY